MIEAKTYMERLKERLNIEFKKQDRSGIYGFTQRSMAYNSNRIEGSTLTEKQTASMFETGTLYADDPDIIFRTKDIEEMNGLLEEYQKIEEITLCDIAKFHAKFENIHPFQDGNGRVGRMIILKQCLENDIIPIIIRDVNKAEYNRYLNKAQHEHDYHGLAAYLKKEQQFYYENTIAMLFDYDKF